MPVGHGTPGTDSPWSISPISLFRHGSMKLEVSRYAHPIVASPLLRLVAPAPHELTVHSSICRYADLIFPFCLRVAASVWRPVYGLKPCSAMECVIFGSQHRAACSDCGRQGHSKLPAVLTEHCREVATFRGGQSSCSVKHPVTHQHDALMGMGLRPASPHSISKCNPGRTPLHHSFE